MKLSMSEWESAVPDVGLWQVGCIGPGAASSQTTLWIMAASVREAFEIAKEQGYTPLWAL